MGTLTIPEGYALDAVYMCSDKDHMSGASTRTYAGNYVAIPRVYNLEVIVAIQKITGSASTFMGRVCARYKK